MRLPLVLWLSLAAAPALAQDAPAPNPEELRAFREAFDRYRDRMTELQSDARAIVAAVEAEERAKIAGTFGTAGRRLEDEEGNLRRATIARLEAFLAKYPRSAYTADMKFRLADLVFEESEIQFFAANEEYTRIEAQAAENPNLQLPPPPLKDYSRSIALYRDILTNHPDYENLADTHYMLAWCYSALNAEQYDPEQARAVNEVIVARYPGTVFANDANMRLGEYYFDLPGTRENPVLHIPTAIAYYEAVLKDGPEGRNYDEAIYKLGWSSYKLNDYDRALSHLVELLDWSDQQFLQTGKPSNMRPEAIQYLAISYADIADRQGRRPVDVAQAHFARIGEKKWAHDVAERLADVLWLQAKWDEATNAFEWLQTRWPTDPKNPVYQQNVALIWGGAGRNAETPSAPRPPIAFPDPEKAQDALAVLAERYSEGSRWYDANRANPDAIAAARSFIETSLAAVAIDYLERATQTGSVEDYRVAAARLQEFMEKFPFGGDYDLYEWYRALALFRSNQYAEAERAYRQILKNERSPYRDGARFQVMKSREQMVLARYGKLVDLPADAVVEQQIQTPYGKTVAKYMLDDEHKAFVAAADDLVGRDFSDPEWAEALERDRAALAYLPAQIYYNYGWYDEARARFEKVIAGFPNTNEAVYASSLYVNTYINEGNLQQVQALTTRFRSMSLGRDADLIAAKRQEFDDIREGAAFNLAFELIQKGDRAGAAEAYVQFMKEYPGSKYYRDALFNAANNYDLSGKADRAIELFEQYVAKYPEDERSKKLYFRIAQTYSSTLDLQKSIQYYDALVRLDPSYQDAPDALYMSAFLREGTGDRAGAARNYERYATTYPQQADAEAVFYRAGRNWEGVSESEAVQFYQRYLKRYPSGDPNSRIEALHKLAAYAEKRRDTRGAAAYWAQIRDVYAGSAGAALTPATRALAAQGALRDLQSDFDAFKTVKWTTTEAKNVEILTKTKAEARKGLEQRALALIGTYQDFETSAAAVYFQGLSYLAYADMAYSMPPPKGLSEDEVIIYQQTVDEKFRLPAEDRGKAVLLAALEKARAEKRWCEWNDRILAELHERYPSEYPSERDEARGEIKAGATSFAPPDPTAPAAKGGRP